jgi:serine/threonine protein kinase/tetratricopeptide (TPR) repeat protein
VETPAPHDAATRDPIGAPPAVPELELQLAMRSVMASMLGRVRDLELGRYRIRERIGQGGCGLVLAAEDPQLGREVAIKVVLPARERDMSTTWQRALQREAQALARLRHPNVVEVFDAGTTEYGTSRDGEPRLGVYVVMERLVGRTLRKWLAAERPSWRAVVDVHLQIARGLAAAHAAGIVHRDVKPDNVLVTDEGRVVLIDFGLADDAQPMGESDTDIIATDASALRAADSSSGSMTRRSRVVGTPAYMAPEQHAGHTVGPAADQYAWCVSLFAALYGAPPFRADSMAELAAAKHIGRVPPPVAGPPRALHRVLRRGLAVRPDDRFVDMDALVLAIERAASGRPRVMPWVLAGAAASVAALSFTSLRSHHPCDASPLAIEDTWSPERRLAITASLGQIPDPNAAALGDRVGERLDAHATRWRNAYDDVCASAATATTLASRLDCLDRSKVQLGDVVTAFESMTIDEVGRAADLLKGLRAPADCALVDDPTPPEHRDELAALRRQVDAMGVSVDATGTMQDEAAARQALARADELGDLVLASELAYRLSQVARAEGRLEEAESHIRTAVFRATAAHDHVRALELMPLLVLSVGSDLGDRAAAEQLIEHAKAMAEHVDDPRHSLASIDNAYAYILIEKDDIDGAVALYRRTAAAFEAIGRPSVEHARAMLAIAGWSVEHNRLDEATAALEQAESILDGVALPTDTTYASIAFQRGGIAESRGDLDAAAAGYREAVDRLRTRVRGHPFVAVGLSGLALAEARRGRFDVAIATAREATELVVAAHGEVHPDVVRYAMMEAQIHWLAGDAAAAVAPLERGMKAILEVPERSEDMLRGAHHLAGWIRLDANDLDGAARHLAVLQSLAVGPGMFKVDFARSTRRLDAALALRRRDVALASAKLEQPTAGPAEPDDYDADFERRLDAALWDRIVAAGGSRPAALDVPDGDWRASADRQITFAAFVRTIGSAAAPAPTLAAAGGP